MAGAERMRYFASVEIPYRADYAYEETLAVFGDVPGDADSLLAAYERLTAAITSGEVSSLPSMSSNERLRVLGLFDRAARLEQADLEEARELRALDGAGPLDLEHDSGARY
jgi:hypothetical protein